MLKDSDKELMAETIRKLEVIKSEQQKRKATELEEVERLLSSFLEKEEERKARRHQFPSDVQLFSIPGYSSSKCEAATDNLAYYKELIINWLAKDPKNAIQFHNKLWEGKEVPADIEGAIEWTKMNMSEPLLQPVDVLNPKDPDDKEILLGMNVRDIRTEQAKSAVNHWILYLKQLGRQFYIEGPRTVVYRGKTLRFVGFEYFKVEGVEIEVTEGKDLALRRIQLRSAVPAETAGLELMTIDMETAFKLFGAEIRNSFLEFYDAYLKSDETWKEIVTEVSAKKAQAKYANCAIGYGSW